MHALIPVVVLILNLHPAGLGGQVDQLMGLVRSSSDELVDAGEERVFVLVALFLPVGPDLVYEAVMQEELGRGGRVDGAHRAVDPAVHGVVKVDSECHFEHGEASSRDAQDFLNCHGIGRVTVEPAPQTAPSGRGHHAPRVPPSGHRESISASIQKHELTVEQAKKMKMITFGAAHTYMAYIWECPPSPLPSPPPPPPPPS